MRQIHDRDELEGKTITALYSDCEELWLGFSDKSFVIFYIARGYYDSANLEIKTEAPPLLENVQGVLKMGLASVAELAALRKDQEENKRAEQERRERAELAKLTAKYGK